jgi:hypothetical protein
MQNNGISGNQLNADAQGWIEKLRQVLLIQSKGKGTVKSYTAEMILLLCAVILSSQLKCPLFVGLLGQVQLLFDNF